MILWDGGYKRTLDAKRKSQRIGSSGFPSRYLTGSLP